MTVIFNSEAVTSVAPVINTHIYSFTGRMWLCVIITAQFVLALIDKCGSRLSRNRQTHFVFTCWIVSYHVIKTLSLIRIIPNYQITAGSGSE